MDTQNMTREQLQAMIAQLQAAKKELPRAERGLTFKVTENKQCVGVYGLGARPVVLYASQFGRIIEQIDELKAFIVANADRLAWKTPEQKAEAVARFSPKSE